MQGSWEYDDGNPFPGHIAKPRYTSAGATKVGPSFGQDEAAEANWRALVGGEGSGYYEARLSSSSTEQGVEMLVVPNL